MVHRQRWTAVHVPNRDRAMGGRFQLAALKDDSACNYDKVGSHEVLPNPVFEGNVLVIITAKGIFCFEIVMMIMGTFLSWWWGDRNVFVLVYQLDEGRPPRPPLPMDCKLQMDAMRA